MYPWEVDEPLYMLKVGAFGTFEIVEVVLVLVVVVPPLFVAVI